jgi:hypothetical protein
MACGVFLYVSAAYFSLSDVYLCKKYKNFLIFFSRKLLLLRKRNTVYTRSKHGFSLRKSKVLSFGGSSLKWSKSIERYSKKANEVSWAGWMTEAKIFFFSYFNSIEVYLCSLCKCKGFITLNNFPFCFYAGSYLGCCCGREEEQRTERCCPCCFSNKE